MRIPNSERETGRWRIDEIVPDFRLEDLWALPAEGGREDFASLIEIMGSLERAGADSRATRWLMDFRRRFGRRLGLDDVEARLAIPGDATATTLGARLPEDLRDSPADAALVSAPFRPLYRTDVEWAAELSNKTVHAVMHLAWVEGHAGRFRGQMAVYVCPRGRFGGGYMALIAPFRHRIVYPALMRYIERVWDERAPQGSI